MSKMTAILAWATSVLLVALLAAPSTGAIAAGDVPTRRLETDSPDPLVVPALEKRGFEVAEGGVRLWGIEQCPATFDLMATCYFNNPAAPYELAFLPPWPGEHTDPATEASLGLDPEGHGAVYRLDPNEAVLIFGTMPPEAAYFGIQSYLFTREGQFSTDNQAYETVEALGAEDIFFHQVPENPDRVSTFDSLSDSINNVVIDRRSGSIWGEKRYFVISPDRYMDKQVRQVLHRLAVPDRDVFSEAVPGNVNLGLEESADEFVTAVRYSRPADGGGEGTASSQWRQAPELTVLRIRDTRRRPPQRYPAWVDDSPEVRTGSDEWHLRENRDALVTAVAEAWNQPCTAGDCFASGRALPFVDTQSAPFNLVGPICDNIGMDCQADTQDASYQFRPGQHYDGDEVYAVIGTLGTQTRNATYVSLGVNNVRLRLGALNVDGSELIGSADPYGVENGPELYVHYFTRTCDGLDDLTHGECTSVPDTPLAVPGNDAASFVERDYMAEGTQRGPDSTLTLPSVVLQLHRPMG